eukprot:10438828-Karenia_brevis.AAC.1
MKSAYRQLPVAQDQQRFSMIAIWHVHRKCWVFGELHAMAFGVAVARRWLAIPVISYFDDFRITDIEEAKGSG